MYVCARLVGTGTADPPLTPGGVSEAMEEEEWRVECGDGRHTARGTYHSSRKQGCVCLCVHSCEGEVDMCNSDLLKINLEEV